MSLSMVLVTALVMLASIAANAYILNKIISCKKKIWLLHIP
jgi:hypothetical protein